MAQLRLYWLSIHWISIGGHFALLFEILVPKLP